MKVYLVYQRYDDKDILEEVCATQEVAEGYARALGHELLDGLNLGDEDEHESDDYEDGWARTLEPADGGWVVMSRKDGPTRGFGSKTVIEAEVWIHEQQVMK